MSAKRAESFAGQAAMPNKTVEDRIMLIARALAELAKAVGNIEEEIRLLRR
jgi:hypothetical protein